MKKKKWVLVVDDDRDTRGQMALLIELLGYETYSAGNVAEALKVFMEHPVDCVITDLVLPDQDGTVILHEVHRLKPGLPVIILTGYPSQDTVQMSLAENAYTYIEKPVQGERIKDLLEHALGVGAVKE
jgi:DNA-binding NtrC family response regulator